MAKLPQRSHLEHMIIQAMKHSAPDLYRALRSDGSLARAISERVDIAEEVYEIEMSGTFEILRANENFLVPFQALKALRSRASKAAIAAAVEF